MAGRKIRKGKKVRFISMFLLYAAPISAVWTCWLLRREDVVNVLFNLVIALVLAAVYATFLRINHKIFYRKIVYPIIYFGSLFLSSVMLGARAGLPLGIFWMFAIVVAALGSGLEVALATHVVLMIQYALLLFPLDKGYYRFVAYILMGIVLVLLFSQLKDRRELPYLAVILLACDGVLQCVVFRLNLVKMKSALTEILVEFASIIVFVISGYIYLRVTGDRGKKELPRTQDQLLLKITEPDFELLSRLESYSADLFQHSERIGSLSYGAVQAIGGDAMLACAGGLYHEIGRLDNEDDYIEAGSKLGQEYGFPDRLLEIMRQHSPNFELPKSAEAAVVMLSDGIISTSDYLEKNGMREKISDGHLVNSVFRNRLETGKLQYAGLTQDQIQILKKFYIENTFIGMG